MKIVLNNIGRRFNQDWIFRGVNYTFESGNRYAILGPNGSGKSTLLKVISGALTPSEGNLHVESTDLQKNSPTEILGIEEVALKFTLAAPYMELIEEFTLAEHLDFHFKLKTFIPDFDRAKVMELLGLEHSVNKQIKFFSSGMKQRLKLSLACCTDSEVLILDEPTTNLDETAIKWFHDLLELTSMQRILIIGSNVPDEYKTCNHLVSLHDFELVK